MIGQAISHYKILEKLGEGGMGIVYKAQDTKLDRTVALKFLPQHLTAHEPERSRFLQEAKAASALNHQNICTIYYLEEVDQKQFIVMEYVEGKTLREIVPVKKMQDAITYAIQIAEALQEAHTHGIVHRDIKTENIMVNSKNQVKVMDFGLAKLKGSLKLTKTSSTIGTLAYMAPEQIEGGEVDARSDIFSFGIVLYEMLTGHLPFRGEHEAAMVYSIVNENPEPLQHYIPDASSELLHIIDRALEKDREERYQTIHDMLIDLRRLKKDSSSVSRQPESAMPMPAGAQPVPPAEAKKGWSKRLWVGGAGLVVLCAVSVVYFLLRAPAARLNPNRTSATLRLPFKEIGYPSLSGDGKWVAFSAKDENGRWDVYWMNTSGSKPTRVTDEQAWYIQSCDISPDLSQIAFDTQSGERNWIPKVKLVASQGGGSRTLADTGTGPKWRPDGTRVGYMRRGRIVESAIPSASGKLEIWSIRPDGTDNRLELIDSVSTSGTLAFCWSPDGGSITWVRNYSPGHEEVMVREMAIGKERQLTSDGKRVDEVIWATNDEILFVSNKSGQTNLWMIPAGGGEAIQVTQGAAPVIGARISADNRTLVYLQMEKIAHIWSSSIDGGNPRQVTVDDAQVSSPSFSPDGKHIAYVYVDIDALSPEAHLYVMDRDGKEKTQLTSGSVKVGQCIWSPDGAWIAYSSRAVREPEDSNRVYLIQPFNLAPPRLLCKGRPMTWPDGENILIESQMKTLRYSPEGGQGTQVYQDSTLVTTIQGSRQLVFFDWRAGRNGFWTTQVDSLGREKGQPKKILEYMDLFGGTTLSRDRRFVILRKTTGDDVWRVSTLSGKAERIGKALPRGAMLWDVSMDGQELLWVWQEDRSKLVLVKNVFE
jgi:serine/threonine protein kinase